MSSRPALEPSPCYQTSGIALGKPVLSQAFGLSFGLALGNVNGDGRVDDAAVTTAQGIVALFLNKKGKLQPQANYLAGVGPTALIFGKFGGKNGLDIATVDNARNRVTVLLHRE